MNLALLRLLQNPRCVLLAQTSSDSTGLLWSEVQWHVLLVLVEQAELCALVCVNDCENLGD